MLFAVATDRQPFLTFLDHVESLLELRGLDYSKLSQSFTMILSEAFGDLSIVNASSTTAINMGSNSSSYSAESDSKISKIEVELEEIAENVKQNIGRIFERGEKFGMLASKSEALKASVS
jgi:hypothetical protein